MPAKAATLIFDATPFVSHSKLHLLWKFDADALSDRDIEQIAQIVRRVIPYATVEGVPRGRSQAGERIAPPQPRGWPAPDR